MEKSQKKMFKKIKKELNEYIMDNIEMKKYRCIDGVICVIPTQTIDISDKIDYLYKKYGILE